jgi:type I restriction enzyme, S subunit
VVDLAEPRVLEEVPVGYRMTELGLLPEEWGVARLEEVAEFSKRPEAAVAPLTTFIPMMMLPESGLYVNRWEERRPDQVRSGVYFRAGDLLLAKITPCLENGKQGIAREVPRGWGYATTEVYPIHGTGVLTEFLAYYFRHQPVRRHLVDQMEGTTGRQRLPKTVVERLLVPVPPLPEQRAIAHVLSTVQRAREATEAVIAATRALKKSLMRHLFTYGPVPVAEAEEEPLRDTKIGRVPERWLIEPLAEVASLLSGGTPSKQRLDWWQGQVPWASPKDLKFPRLADTEDHVTPEAAQYGSRMAPAGSLLIVIRGMILVRDVPVALAEVPMAFNQDLKAIQPGRSVLADYLLYAFQFHKWKLARDIGTSAHGTRRIGTSALERFLVPVPTLAEQKQIAEALAQVDTRISALSIRSSALDVLSGSLLGHLMSGQVRPPAR